MNTAAACVISFLALCHVALAQVDFQIRSIERNSNGDVTITWPVLPGWASRVQSSNSLTGEWNDIVLGTQNFGTNEFGNFYIDVAALGSQQRFYRIANDRLGFRVLLVLDRSGSMLANGGAQSLAPSVSAFLDFFNDVVDAIGMVSFATTAVVDVPIRTDFKTVINTALSSLVFTGATFAEGGLSNALGQIQSVAVLPGENPVKAVVFFSDGGANLIQETFVCNGVPTTYNVGGYDSGNGVGFFDPITGQRVCVALAGTPPPCCPGVSTFISEIDGLPKSLTVPNVNAEASIRAIQAANSLRANGATVFSIGLGNNINYVYLREIANDPSSPIHNPSQPTGIAVFAPTVDDLMRVFQYIASQITTNSP